VRNTKKAWQLYNTAKTWSLPPSQLMGLEEEFDAFCLDEAIAALGNGIENRLLAITGKNADWARQRELMVIMGVTEEEKASLFKVPTPT